MAQPVTHLQFFARTANQFRQYGAMLAEFAQLQSPAEQREVLLQRAERWYCDADRIELDGKLIADSYLLLAEVDEVLIMSGPKCS